MLLYLWYTPSYCRREAQRLKIIKFNNRIICLVHIVYNNGFWGDMEEWFGRRWRRYRRPTYLSSHCSIVVPIRAARPRDSTFTRTPTTLRRPGWTKESTKNGARRLRSDDRTDRWRSMHWTLIKPFCMIRPQIADLCMHNAWRYFLVANIECSKGCHDQNMQITIFYEQYTYVRNILIQICLVRPISLISYHSGCMHCLWYVVQDILGGM